MRRMREILRLLWDLRLGVRHVARSCEVSHATVVEYRERAVAAGLSWEQVASMDAVRLERLLFPSVAGPSARPLPVWSEVYEELKGRGVTLQLLWEEYRAVREDGYGYSQFCKLYGEWRDRLDLSMRQEHRAGEKLFVDYCGQSVPVIDPATGEVHEAQIFVAVLGASNYTFAEATWSQKVPDWIGSHVRALEFFGGVSELVIPDNLRSGVSKACRYEPALNTTYHELAQHYGVAVIPARVGRPKDKAKVEVGVLVVERWILACLRRRQFFSLRELNEAIAEHLERLNHRRFKKLPGSRRSQFEALDQPALRPLPATRFEDCEWRKVRVRRDYHVEVDGHFYSVPFPLVDRQLEVRLTATGVECLHHEQRVACHPRSAVVGASTTCKEHMPPAHRSLAEQTPETVTAWAEQAGASTAQVVSRILASRAHPQQGLKVCAGLRRLGRDYGLDRLEGACRYALEIHGLSFQSVRSILERGLDRREPRARPAGKTIVHDNVRGAKYFQTEAQPEEVAPC